MNRALLLVLLTACEIGPAIYIERGGDGKGEITSDPEGLHCGDESDCAMIVDDAVITLTAMPAHGSRFTGWTNAACEGPSCTLTLAADTHVGARFDLVHYPVAVTRVGSGRVTGTGIDCGDTCEITAAFNTRLELHAVPDADMVLASWRGACAGSYSPCVITVTDAVGVEAVFEPKPKVAVTVVGNGRVVSDLAGIDCGTQCAHSFADGSSVTLRPLAEPGWTFVGWEGPCMVLPMGCLLLTKGYQPVTATFAPTSQLALEIVGPGTIALVPPNIVCYQSCTYPFAQGTHVTLTPHANNGATFLGWEGACTGTGNCELDATAANVSVRARFATAPAACTTSVTTSETAAQFNARLTVPNAVICLANGITITGPVVFGASGITVRRAAPGAAVQIVNPTGDAIDLAGHAGIKLHDLEIISSGGSLTSALVAVGAAASVEVRESTLRCSGANCYIVKATNSSTVSITHSTLSGMNFSYGVYGWYGAKVHLENSSVHSLGVALYVSVGSVFVVKYSTLVGLSTYVGSGQGTLMVYNSGASLDLSDSTVTTYEYRALLAGGASSGVTVRLDNNRFRKAAGTVYTSFPPIWSERDDNVFLSSVPNTFCNEGTSTSDGEFSTILITGGYTSSSTFFGAGQSYLGDCP